MMGVMMVQRSADLLECWTESHLAALMVVKLVVTMETMMAGKMVEL